MTAAGPIPASGAVDMRDIKVCLCLLMMALSWNATAQAPDLRLPAGLRAGSVPDAAAMAGLARDAAAAYRDDDRQRYLGTLFRLQMVAGDYPQAVRSIEQVRTSRGDPAAQPPLYLQYEIHARAKALQATRGLAYADAWRQVFAERFGALDDKTAFAADYGFGSHLPRLRDALDAAVARAAGRTRMPLADAIDLIRAYQVHAAYAEFQPLFADALAQDDARRYVVDREALVRSADGAGISTLVVRPVAAPPLPALLTFTIYANDDWAWLDAKKMAAHGYAGVVSYTRGKGRSTDAIVPFEHDGADATAVIDWIAAQPWSDGRVGMFGGSYSGYTQWSALGHQPAALKAIATSATVAPGIDVPMEGGIWFNFMYPWPFYAASNRSLDDARYGDSERWARLNRDAYASGRAYRERPAIDGSANPVFARWLQHPDYDAYWQAMIPQGEAFADIDIPVLATTGYFDGGQIGVLHYLREHLRQRPDADHTLVIGPYEHFAMQRGVPPVVQGYAVDPSARIDLQALRLEWFDHVLKGAPRPALLADRINWQVMGADRWRHAPTLEAMATRRQRLYLVPGNADDAGGTNRLAKQAAPQAETLQRIDFRDRSDAGWTPPENVVHDALDPHLGLVFVGEPLPEGAEWAGPFTGVLEFSVNKRDVDIAIGVYELDADGRYLDLGYWLQRASYAQDRRHRRLLEPGATQRIEVKDTRVLGRRMGPGSRLVVTVGAIKQPDIQLNLGSGKNPSDETIADAGEPMELRLRGSSYLEVGVGE